MKDKHPFSDQGMQKALLNEKNIPVLEELIRRDARRYEHIRPMPEGNLMSAKELVEALPDIANKVCSFLDVSGIALPKISYARRWDTYLGLALSSAGAVAGIVAAESGYVNFGTSLGLIAISTLLVNLGILKELSISKYFRRSKHIRMSKPLPRGKAIPIIAHEYTHHVLHEIGVPKGHSAFHEGMAIGVERYVSGILAKKENNDAILLGTIKHSLREYTDVLIWICSNLRRKYDKRILDYPAVQMCCGTGLSGDGYGPPNEHSIGNSLLSIYAAVDGQDIYRKILKR